MWEKELWADIWEAVQKTNVFSFHVDAHSVPNSMELWYNSITDRANPDQGRELIQIQRTQDLTFGTQTMLNKKIKYGMDHSQYSILRFRIYPEYSKQCSICGQTYRSMEYNRVPRNDTYNMLK